MEAAESKGGVEQKLQDRQHDAAAAWGIMIPGRPPLAPGEFTDKYSLYPYIVEELDSMVYDGPAKITLVHLNGLWGYSLRIRASLSGHSYGPSVWCTPYPTRQAAITAAAKEIEEYIKRGGSEKIDKVDRRILRWLDTLTTGEQMSLFGEAT